MINFDKLQGDSVLFKGIQSRILIEQNKQTNKRIKLNTIIRI